MKCSMDCFKCPYPDCIYGEEPEDGQPNWERFLNAKPIKGKFTLYDAPEWSGFQKQKGQMERKTK